ncbi:MAG: adenosylcobinamide amidohydrolase [Sporomusaceae bacterium]|nr:adenosylcobinamide amidohydrolase [Sporomusaceae bacterium]
MRLCTLSSGDAVYRYYKSLVIQFNGPRKVLSTSVHNGGYREDLTAVFNHDCNPGAGMACMLRAPSYEGHMRLVAEELGLEPERSSGMATAASMENAAIKIEQYEALAVTALVTGGVEINGGRVGDPACYYSPLAKVELERPGTINIMLAIDADLPLGILARALVTCTEAKTAALQELMVGSNYSSGLATGSGTDSTIVIANPMSPLLFETAGKHSKLGELIGRAVTAAVKEALLLQSGLSPASQHSALRRLKRYGITAESLWQLYRENGGKAAKARFVDCLCDFEHADGPVVYSSLLLHLLDQRQWRLLSAAETHRHGGELLAMAAAAYGVDAPPLSEGDEALLAAWSHLIVKRVDSKLTNEEN